VYILPPPENTDPIVHHLNAVRANFCDGTFKYSLGGTKCDDANDAIFAWMDVGDHGSGPIDWRRVVFLQEDECTRLEVRRCLQPASQAMELIGLPSLPELL